FPVVDCDFDKEQKHHEFLLKVWNSNFLAPVESILLNGDARVLDVGSGFGSWIYDMAKSYPLSHFNGIDMLVPKNFLANVSFTQADVLEGLQYPNCYFDYIHMRDVLWYISTKDVRNKLFPDLLRVLKPGGWIESVEYDTEIMNKVSSYFRNHGIYPDEFYKNTSKLFKENKLEYQVEERILCFSDCELIVKFVILEYTSISHEKYDEILDKVSSELIEYKTSFRSIRHYGKKLPG
ncbi:23624_t:CDS:2, partial [Racocetra persica]